MTSGKLLNFSAIQCLLLYNRANNSPYSCQSWASCPHLPSPHPSLLCHSHRLPSPGSPCQLCSANERWGGRGTPPGYFFLSLCLGDLLWELLPLLSEGPQLWAQLS